MRRRSRQSGVMLILTMGLFAVLWFVVLGFANASMQSLRQARQQVAGEQAYWAAEGGMRLALRALTQDPKYRPTPEWARMTHSKSSRYKIEVLEQKNAPIAIPSECVYVLVTGQDPSGMQHRMVSVVKLGGKAKSLLGFSVFANSLSLAGGCKIDSFDSTVGTGVRGSQANVATNSVTPGAINLVGGSWIQGTIQVGPGGATGVAKPSQPTTKSSNVVWKDWSCWSLEESAMTSPLEFPPVAAPAAGTNDVNVDWKGVDLQPGAYKNLQASGGGEVKLRGGATYVFRSLKLTGGAKLSYTGTEPVTVYVLDELDLTGGTLYNTSGKPKNMTFMLAKDANAKMTGGAQAFAVVYGPEANFTLQGGTDLWGAIVARTVTLMNGASIHYDTDLLKSPPPGLSSSSGGGGGTTVLSQQRL
jgi:hypothetical protein